MYNTKPRTVADFKQRIREEFSEIPKCEGNNIMGESSRIFRIRSDKDIRRKHENRRVRHVRLLGGKKKEQHNRCVWCRG